MRARVLFFGVLKDITGRAQEIAEFPDGSTLGTVFDRYAADFPAMAALRHHIRPARNREFSEFEDSFSADDEIAFLPPVSGGSDVHVSITREPIDTNALVRLVQTPGDGAIVTFEGVVRNNTRGRETLCLEYEAYEPMALETMSRIAGELRAGGEITRIAIVHRLGRLEVGEASISIAVSAPHRRAAFDAARQAIDRVKSTVPIWKKEHFADGAVWVEGQWDQSSRPA